MGNKKRSGGYVDVAKRHQLNIARSTLRMSDAGALIAGGQTKQEARRCLWDHHKGNEAAYLREIERLEGDTNNAADR